MRQAGIVAAAMDYALDHHVERLANDHANALALAEGLSQLKGIRVEPAQTNMVYVNFESGERARKVSDHLRKQDIVVGAAQRMRLVTHLGIPANAIERIVTAFRGALEA